MSLQPQKHYLFTHFNTEKQKKKQTALQSSLQGRISKNFAEDMARACSMLKQDLNATNIDYFKHISSTINIEFPATHTKSSLRLMSILHDGCSGAPLIIKQENLFTIFGIHTSGGFFPRFPEQSEIIKSEEVYYINNFVDLTLYSQWISETIHYMTCHQ